MKISEKNKLLNSIAKIFLLFNNKKEYRQKIKDINSKILMNKQIIEEIKRRKDENAFIHKDQINNAEASVNKKGGAVKLFQKKFNEVEIFIQRESITPENMEKYGKWKTFTLIPFMEKNEDLLKRRCFYGQEIRKIKEKIELIEKENNNIKEENKILMNELDENKKIEKIFENNFKFYDNKIEFIKRKINIISDINIKKSTIPSFKSSNPISNLDVNLNLLEPGIVELELNLKKIESEEIKIDEKEQIKKMNIDLNKINEKFEKDLKNETGENTLKGKEMKPPENENWGDFNSFDNISDIEKDN